MRILKTVCARNYCNISTPLKLRCSRQEVYIRVFWGIELPRANQVSEINDLSFHNRPFLILESDLPPQKGKKKSAEKSGEIRGKDETLEYWDGERWVPAVYHYAVRNYLMREAEKRGKYGELFPSYSDHNLLIELDHPRARGLDPVDITSFLESQKSWGPVRDQNWADILYFFEKRENHQDPKYKLKKWKIGKRIVIAGHDNLPILDYRDIPEILSSALEGRDMEAMKRTDSRIQQRDFIARMPMKHTTNAGTRRKLQTASSIGMRMTRFRSEHGMLSWVGREGSRTIRDALWESLPEQNKRENSIRGLKPPSVSEQEKIREGNQGKFLNRAGKRALSDEERAKRLLTQQRRREKREKRGEGRSPANGVSDSTSSTTKRKGDQSQEEDHASTRADKRWRPEFPDNKTRQDKGSKKRERDVSQEDHDSLGEDGASPRDGKRKRLNHLSQRPIGEPRRHPRNTRERSSASSDRYMQPSESVNAPTPFGTFQSHEDHYLQVNPWTKDVESSSYVPRAGTSSFFGYKSGVWSPTPSFSPSSLDDSEYNKVYPIPSGPLSPPCFKSSTQVQQYINTNPKRPLNKPTYGQPPYFHQPTLMQLDQAEGPVVRRHIPELFGEDILVGGR